MCLRRIAISPLSRTYLVNPAINQLVETMAVNLAACVSRFWIIIILLGVNGKRDGFESYTVILFVVALLRSSLGSF